MNLPIQYETTISFQTTNDVKQCLTEIADKNNCTLEQLLRDITDDFLLNQPE